MTKTPPRKPSHVVASASFDAIVRDTVAPARPRGLRAELLHVPALNAVGKSAEPTELHAEARRTTQQDGRFHFH